MPHKVRNTHTRRAYEQATPILSAVFDALPTLSSQVFPIARPSARAFFGDEDYELYRDLPSSRRRKQGVAV